MGSIKRLVKESGFYPRLRRALGHNHLDGLKGNDCDFGCAVMSGTTVAIHGRNNIVRFSGTACYLKDCTIVVYGDDNLIEITDSTCVGLNIHVEDNGNCVKVGKGTSFTGECELAAIEGTCITVGDDCLFSSKIRIATGDSHAVLDAKTGRRINPSASIVIGNHVWVGYSVSILKGVSIGDNSIVGSCAVVTRPHTDMNVALAGNPAAIVKRGVDWNFNRNAGM